VFKFFKGYRVLSRMVVTLDLNQVRPFVDTPPSRETFVKPALTDDLDAWVLRGHANFVRSTILVRDDMSSRFGHVSRQYRAKAASPHAQVGHLWIGPLRNNSSETDDYALENVTFDWWHYVLDVWNNM